MKYENGNICWFKKGTRILHRESGPAIDWINGDKAYYIDDEYIGEFNSELIRYRESYLMQL